MRPEAVGRAEREEVARRVPRVERHPALRHLPPRGLQIRERDARLREQARRADQRVDLDGQRQLIELPVLGQQIIEIRQEAVGCEFVAQQRQQVGSDVLRRERRGVVSGHIKSVEIGGLTGGDLCAELVGGRIIGIIGIGVDLVIDTEFVLAPVKILDHRGELRHHGVSGGDRKREHCFFRRRAGHAAQDGQLRVVRRVEGEAKFGLEELAGRVLQALFLPADEDFRGGQLRRLGVNALAAAAEQTAIRGEAETGEIRFTGQRICGCKRLGCEAAQLRQRGCTVAVARQDAERPAGEGHRFVGPAVVRLGGLPCDLRAGLVQQDEQGRAEQQEARLRRAEL